MKLSVFEWNIHMMAKAIDVFPNIIEKTIQVIEKKHDVIVLVEYKQNKEFEQIFIDNGYYVLTNSPQPKNEIFIAIKSDVVLQGTYPIVISILPIDKDEYPLNFCHVMFYCINEQLVSIIGVRKVDKIDYRIQIKPLARYISNLYNFNKNSHSIIVTGDFNSTNNSILQIISSEFNVLSPDHDKNKYYTDYYIDNYSYFFTGEDGYISGMNSLDHVISNLDNSCFENLCYDWKFTSDSSYPATYGTIEKHHTYWRIPRGYPDHATLTFDINL